MRDDIQSAARDVESIEYVVAGMVSTLQFTPSQTHPMDCLELAHLIVAQVRRYDSPTIRENTNPL